MPLYEYQCDSCGHRFEVIQKYSDPLVSVCPKCGGPVQKLLSSPAIQFKGSGFYITDYPRSGKGDSANVKAGKTDAAPSDTSTSSSSKESTSSTSSDAKPAAPTTTKPE